MVEQAVQTVPVEKAAVKKGLPGSQQPSRDGGRLQRGDRASPQAQRSGGIRSKTIYPHTAFGVILVNFCPFWDLKLTTFMLHWLMEVKGLNNICITILVSERQSKAAVICK